MTLPTQPINRSGELNKLKEYLIGIISRNLEEFPPAANNRPQATKDFLNQAYLSTKVNLPVTLRDQLFQEISDDLLGLGPSQSWLDDDAITEIMVNGPNMGYGERNGKLEKTG